MKLNYLGTTLVVGMLAASPAYAWSNVNRATYALRHGCPVQPTASQTQPEIQVAVMANSSSQPAATKPDLKELCPTVSIWYGSGSSTHATHSH